MIRRRTFLWGLLSTPVAAACSRAVGEDSPVTSNTSQGAQRAPADVPPVGSRLTLTDAQWRGRLSAQEYRVLRDKGTERAFTGDLLDEHRAGTFVCAGCGAPLFASADKFESGTGWPSFTRPIERGRVREERDATLGMVRVETVCARCDGHLGHVFDDGPAPTGLRYCINSVALDFTPERR